MFQVIVVAAACFEPFLGIMKSYVSDLKTLLERTEMIWPVLLIAGVRYLAKEVVGKEGKGSIRVQSFILIRWKSRVQQATSDF